MHLDVSRRELLTGGLAAAGLAALGGVAGAADTSGTRRAHRPLREPGSLPHPDRPAGTPDPHIPIEHIVIVMMENHSFDNYFGMLPKRGQPLADGFHFTRHRRPTNSNPTKGGYIRSFRMPSACQPEHEPNQSWDGTHTAIAGGRMTGFVRASGDTAMGYWDQEDLPFYYAIAKHFTLANRWFCSAPCQTYPNRRYLMAATSWGEVSTILPGPNDPPPPHGTIFDRLNAHKISWRNYFTDLPQTALIPSVVKSNPTRISPISEFYVDCATGNLPAVSFVDPDFGLADVIGGLAPGSTIPTSVRAQGQDEENPQNIRFGEAFVAAVTNAVISSPAWKHTLLLWFYDEHGGYYDHVPPPRAVPPDSIKPILGNQHAKGGFDIYGPRVPAVVISPWSRPHAVTNVVHDHTSVLKFIEQKWNLPAMTRRDANAHGLRDFLDFSRPRLLEPPDLPRPADPIAADRSCDTSEPVRPVRKTK
ncbi:MAG TPA: alkaline phosphatase family protein [Mycobacteriales bacterium]|nr:alkaline phosphatase family protein [Mycobacteriales bacterium]